MASWDDLHLCSILNDGISGCNLLGTFLLNHRAWAQSCLFPLTEHIRQRAFKLFHHRIQPPQGDGLLTPLQSEYRGRWKSNLFRELGERHVSPLSAEEFCQLFVQW